MGRIVDLIEEIRLRLSTAQLSGSLTSVKRIRVGSISEARLMSDFPIININLSEGSVIPSFVKAGHTAPCIINIQIISNKLDETGNSQYKISGETGIIFLIEEVINAMDNNTSGVLDLGFNAKSYNLREYNYSISESEHVIEASIRMSITTRQFVAGSL